MFLFPETRASAEYRFGWTKSREKPIAHVGMEAPRENDSPLKLAQAEFAQNLKPLPTSPGLWAPRRRPLSSDEIKSRRRKVGELCSLAAVS